MFSLEHSFCRFAYRQNKFAFELRPLNISCLISVNTLSSLMVFFSELSLLLNSKCGAHNRKKYNALIENTAFCKMFFQQFFGGPKVRRCMYDRFFSIYCPWAEGRKRVSLLRLSRANFIRIEILWDRKVCCRWHSWKRKRNFVYFVAYNFFVIVRTICSRFRLCHFLSNLSIYFFLEFSEKSLLRK